MIKFINNLWLNIYVLINPIYWISNYRTNKAWDKQLNSMLDNPKIEYVNEYSVKLNGIKIWVSNYPYAYGSPYNQSILPTRKTRIRLRNVIDNFVVEYLKEQVCK